MEGRGGAGPFLPSELSTGPYTSGIQGGIVRGMRKENIEDFPGDLG